MFYMGKTNLLVSKSKDDILEICLTFLTVRIVQSKWLVAKIVIYFMVTAGYSDGLFLTNNNNYCKINHVHQIRSPT